MLWCRNLQRTFIRFRSQTTSFLWVATSCLAIVDQINPFYNVVHPFCPVKVGGCCPYVNIWTVYGWLCQTGRGYFGCQGVWGFRDCMLNSGCKVLHRPIFPQLQLSCPIQRPGNTFSTQSANRPSPWEPVLDSGWPPLDCRLHIFLYIKSLTPFNYLQTCDTST